MRDRVAWWLFATFALLYLCTARGHFIVTSEINDYQTVRSLWDEGSLRVGWVLGSLPGRDGQRYSPHGAGQAVAALPLFGLGRGVRRALEAVGAPEWVGVLAGPSIGQEPSRWGGDIELFFVSLLNAFLSALVCVVYYAFARDLGASPRSALTATILLGTSTYVAALSSSFLTHPGDTALLLLALRALVRGARVPSWQASAAAGAWMGLMLLFRPPSVVAWPALLAYFAWSVVRPSLAPPTSRLARVIAFGSALLAGVAVHAAVTYAKFGTWLVKLDPNDPSQGFRTPLLTGLFGFLFSPGASIFVFSPLLLLVPWLYRLLWRRAAPEAALFLAVSASFLLVCAKFTSWHGLTDAVGPRYLSPIVPILLLPLGVWLTAQGRRVWLAVTPLVVVGVGVQALCLAVNFSYVYYHAGYADFVPPTSFLFIPDVSPLVEHWRGLRAWDHRVDLWLVNVQRGYGLGRACLLGLPLATALGFSGWRLARAARDAQETGRRDSESGLAVASRPTMSVAGAPPETATS